MRTLDEPESPDFSPDGKKVVFAALQDGTGDIFVVDLQTQEITNLTKDAFADSAPTWAPDGQSIVYLARISGNEKLFRLDLATGQKTQLTFGTHDDASAQFLDADTLVFPSTATDPAQPIDPDVARNGQIYNVWTLSLKNGELQQFTDAVERQPVHRRAQGRNGHAADRRHHLLQGRVRAALARPPRSDRHGRLVRLRRAGPHHRLPGAAVAHAGRRQEREEGQVREDVHGRSSARERRRHERRRHLRRLGGQLQRRARRPAVQPLCGVDLAVPDAVALLSEPRASLQLRAPGLLADAVLLRRPRERLLRPEYLGLHRSRPVDCDANDPWRLDFRHLAVQPLPENRSRRRSAAVQRELQRPRAAGVLGWVPAGAIRPRSCSDQARISRWA